MKRCLLLLMCLLLTGCAPAESPDPPGFTFTDDLGREVEVRSSERVACLIGSFADLWCLAGGQECLVAAANDAWTSFDLGLSQDVMNVGGVKEPSLEVLLSAQPTLVLASANTQSQVALRERMEALGLTVAYFNVSSFEDYLRMLDVCTTLTGQRQRYEAYGEALQRQVDDAKARSDGSAPKVLYIRATLSSCKVKGSQDSVLGEMLFDLGCINIADQAETLLEELSLEVILQQDPDHIFAVLQGSDPRDAQKTLEQTLLRHPVWASLTAVQEGRFHVMDAALYNLKPNARWGDAYEQLAQILYP